MKNYPLNVGNVDDYPVKVGSMLLTLVDPNKGFERAYNRWYERDHYYAGCMVGPYLYAGSRWVATRELKDLRWPAGANAVADSTDAGSYVAIYFIERDHHTDFEAWARPQVNALYTQGRGFPERKHVHTVMFDHIGAAYRDADPVPVDLALDRGYAGIFCLWFDAAKGTANTLHQQLQKQFVPELLNRSSIESVASWTPRAGENEEKKVPMHLGSRAGGSERLLQLLFVGGDVRETVARVREYANAVEKAKLAELRLAAPFIRTVVGTDIYTDSLW
jgi:hypothetical protein